MCRKNVHVHISNMYECIPKAPERGRHEEMKKAGDSMLLCIKTTNLQAQSFCSCKCISDLGVVEFVRDRNCRGGRSRSLRSSNTLIGAGNRSTFLLPCQGKTHWSGIKTFHSSEEATRFCGCAFEVTTVSPAEQTTRAVESLPRASCSLTLLVQLCPSFFCGCTLRNQAGQQAEVSRQAV